MVLNRTTGIPTEFIDVIQALIILFVAAPLLVREILRIRNNRKEVAIMAREKAEHLYRRLIPSF